MNTTSTSSMTQLTEQRYLMAERARHREELILHQIKKVNPGKKRNEIDRFWLKTINIHEK